MHVTPSLKQSYVVACDLPIPAWNYLHRGHQVTIAVDTDAVTAFRRDSSGKTPLDRLEILKEDLNELSDFLDAPLGASPKTYGALFRYLRSHGVGLVANQEALRVRKIAPSEMDPMITVVTGADFKKLMSDVDALLPFDDLAVPHHPLFHRGGH
jgi:predicted peroxiredoxin